MSKLALAKKPADAQQDVLEFFDQRPLELDGWLFTATAAKPLGTPTKEQCRIALRFAVASEKSSPYWIGDVLAYGTSREDWRETFDGLIEESGLAVQTIYHRTSISRKVTGIRRDLSPSIGHSALVAKFPPEIQEFWLEKARTEKWTTGEFRRELRHAQRKMVASGQHPDMFDVLVTVKLTVEAVSPFAAEELARAKIRDTLKLSLPGARVIGATAPGRAT